jgi:hypothetical protein
VNAWTPPTEVAVHKAEERLAAELSSNAVE